jgi:Tol biopolymer transport system component/PKD repeat protein
VKKLALVLLALVILVIPFTATGCEKLPQVAFDVNPASGKAPLTVVFSNTTFDGGKNDSVVYDWNFGDGQTKLGATFTEAISHQYSKVGTYTVTVTCYKKGAADKTTTVSKTITVAHGALDNITLAPETIELAIGQTQTFKTEAFDSSRNPITDASVTWKSAQAGTVTGDGVFTAGHVAGTYSQDITVTAEQDTAKLSKSADVVIKPDPLETTTLESLAIGAGESKQLTAVGKDKYGNILQGLETTWYMVNTAAGTITAGGLYTAPKKAGSFTSAVKVTLKQGTKMAEAIGNVNISPGELTQLGIVPGNINLGKGMSQQFYAACADKYGNPINSVPFKWECNAAAGTITADGLFTAGTSPASYKDGVTVTAGTTAVKTSALVNVENDRIIFCSNRADKTANIITFYIMNTDGTDVEEFDLVHQGSMEFRIDASRDGHRLIYTAITTNDNVTTSTTYICNTEGKWVTTLDVDDKGFEAVLSPDGTKVAFQSWRTEKADIYVMNIDGSDCRNLTNDDAYDDYPAWSPDGSKIVFISDKINGEGVTKLFSINADGTGRKQLTTGSNNDRLPQYSPDGKQILFQSDRFGSYVWNIFLMNADGSNLQPITTDTYSNSSLGRWSPDGSKIVYCSNSSGNQFEIYVANPDGTNAINITNNDAMDVAPFWLYPKKGIAVDANSVKLKENFGEVDMTAQDISDMASNSVVRIEVITALGKSYGSGFFIRSNGVILTNNHVVTSAETIEKINVYVPGGDVFTGTVLARDRVHDLALVKIETSGVTALQIGSFGSVQSGERVVVLGYPLGHDSISVTSGLVSSIEFDDGVCTTWIQTDSAINPGNSGGPLFDMSGKVIGIVAAKIFGVGIEGMGYAISADTIQLYLARLLSQAGIS